MGTQVERSSCELLPLQRLYYPRSWPPIYGCTYGYGINNLTVLAGHEYTSNDFYNALYLQTWSITANDLVLRLLYSSSSGAILEIWYVSPHGSPKCIVERSIPPANDNDPLEYEISLVGIEKNLTRGRIYCRLLSTSTNLSINEMVWLTTQPKKRSPVLGLVITHYLREQQVIAFVESIKNTEIMQKLTVRDIVVIIVDNSQTLTPANLDAEGLYLIQNENYGGSGGFARGMLQAEALGCSHCLLLDDDASMGVEGIMRIWNRHAFAIKDSAISAILLKEEHPLEIIEAASNYKCRCLPIAPNFNILDLERLNWIWSGSKPADYGSWCGFSFPFSDILHYPFPFFVRGDDILFSLMNKLEVSTINGVVSKVPVFDRKHGPLQALLDTRSVLAINSIQRCSIYRQLLGYIKPYLNELLTYRYGHCLARHKALWMHSLGVSGYINDMDGSFARSIAKNYARYWPASIGLQDVPGYRGKLARTQRKRKKINRALIKILVVLTLNGHLLPFAGCLKRNIFLTTLRFRIAYVDCFMSSSIFMEDRFNAFEPIPVGKHLFFNQPIGLLCIAYLLLDSLALLMLGSHWSRKLLNEIYLVASREFWKKTYKL
jgi:galactofuranosylgalactofuranosylrhamnosyl-N-acetylglucosaminyl-diphospho-decaprenol beta-1,5/1,6-galactofuranosyltransferase